MAAIITLGIVFGGVIALMSIIFINMNKPSTGMHTGPYIPAVNPFRIGGTVLVCEDPARPELNWYGTVLSTRGPLLTIRDTSSPYHTVDLEKSYVYPAATNLGW